MSEILVNTIKKADGTGGLTIPTGTGTVLTTTGNGSGLSGVTGGLKVFTMYRYTVTEIANQTPMQNWTSVDTTTPGVTVSSGVFTFPETGKYYIYYEAELQTVASGTTIVELQTTTDNGNSYSGRARAVNEMSATGGHGKFSTSNNLIFDVINTSNYKARLIFNRTSTDSFLSANSNENRTTVTFLKLGDT
jgi:hypothetical protein